MSKTFRQQVVSFSKKLHKFNFIKNSSHCPCYPTFPFSFLLFFSFVLLVFHLDFVTGQHQFVHRFWGDSRFHKIILYLSPTEKRSLERESELPRVLQPNNGWTKCPLSPARGLSLASFTADGQTAFERVTPGPFHSVLPHKTTVGLSLFPPGRQL